MLLLPSPLVPLLLMVTAQCASGLDNGVGVRPTLGWNSWNRFAGQLDEKVVRDTASLLVSTGLAAKGYTYLNLDDTWAASNRSANGSLVPDPVKFPTPMAALVKEVHGQGLHFGIYTDVGWMTCARRPGTYGHEVQDANTFADWSVDFVKSDSCYTAADPKSAPADAPRCYADYQRFAAALNATGRAMVHSIKGPCGINRHKAGAQACSPADSNAIAHLRRAAGDVKDNWASIIEVLEDAAKVVNVTRPGFFADLDILEIGNGGLTQVEERSVFSLWCAVKSPLLLGNDLSQMSAATLKTVGNVELLAVNPDVLGLAARRVSGGDEVVQVWAGKLGQAGPRGATWRGPVADERVDERIVVVFNTGNATVTQEVRWQDTVKCPPSLEACSWDVRDLWSGRVSPAAVGMNITVPSHASVVLRLENATSVDPNI